MDTNVITSEYIEKWKQFENYIKKRVSDFKEKDLMKKVEYLAKEGGIGFLKSNLDSIKQLYEIRNTLTHKESSQFFAYPNTYALNKLNDLIDRINKPRYIVDVVNNKPIIFDEDNSLLDVLRIIKTSQITQFPLRTNGKINFLVTTNSISLWLSQNMEDNGDLVQSLSSVKLLEVIKFNETRDLCKFINRQTTVDDFVVLIEQHNEVCLWIITDNGKNFEKPLSVISFYDFPDIYKQALKL